MKIDMAHIARGVKGISVNMFSKTAKITMAACCFRRFNMVNPHGKGFVTPVHENDIYRF